MKKGVFASAFLALLLMTNFVSAAFHYGFGGFGGGFVDWPTLVLNVSIFFILFALINWSLSRTRIFHGGTLTVLSLASAFITYYYAFYRTNFHLNISRYFSDLLFNFGLSGDFIFPILSFIVIIILVLLARKIGLHGVLIGLGLFMIGLASLTDIFYEDFAAFFIGVVLVGLGLLIWWFWGRRSRASALRSRYIGRFGIFAWFRRGWSWIIVGLIIAALGFFTGSGGITYIGIGLILIGILLFLFGGRRHFSRGPGNGGTGRAPPQSPQPRQPITDPRRLLAPPKRRGWTGASETLAYNYDARRSKKIEKARAKAEKAAYKEETERQRAAKKKKMEDMDARYLESRKREKLEKLKQRYEKIIKRLNSMPGGSYIKKGSPGYNEYISLYREAQDLAKKLGIN